MTILVGVTLCYGAFRVSTARFRPGPRVALLQSNLRQGHKFERDPGDVHRRFRELIRRAMAHDPRPDLIVWPETSYPFYPFIRTASDLDPAILQTQVAEITDGKLSPAGWLDKQKAVVQDMHSMAADLGVSMLVGSSVYEHQPDRLHKYNSALLFQPSRPEYEFYHKMHLVPFGEFIPLIDMLPWLSALTPYRDKIPSLDFGREPRIFQVGPYRIAAVICFEDTIPQVIGRVLPRRRPVPTARPAGQPLQRRLVSRLVRARHASGHRRLPDDRAPRPPGPRREHRLLLAGRRQRRDPRPAPQGRRGRADRPGPARRPHDLVFAMGRLAGPLLSGRHDRMDPPGPGPRLSPRPSRRSARPAAPGR